MARRIKCKSCGDLFDRELMHEIGSKKFCSTCHQSLLKEKKDREDLYHYIQESYDIPFPTGRMLRDIKIYKEERGYTYKNMRLTLKYAFERKNFQPDKKYSLGCVPYFYDEMIEYYKDLKKKMEQRVKPVEQRKVKISSKQFTNKKQVSKSIDMNNLL